MSRGQRNTILVCMGIIIVLAILLAWRAPAKADTVAQPVDSCLDGWFWKAGTGENEVPPSLTPDGLLFNDQDTVNAVIAWHFVDVDPADVVFPDGKWSMVEFGNDARPGPNAAFKMITNPWTGTWNYQGNGMWWASGYGSDIAAGDYNSQQMIDAIAFADARVAAFGLGTETISTDDAWIVRNVGFVGNIYSLVCVPAVVPSPVPGPVVTKYVTVSPSLPVITQTPESSPTSTPTSIPVVTRTATPQMQGPPLDDSHGDALPIVPIVVGSLAALASIGVIAAGIIRRRSKKRAAADLEDIGSHAYGVDHLADQTQPIPKQE